MSGGDDGCGRLILVAIALVSDGLGEPLRAIFFDLLWWTILPVALLAIIAWVVNKSERRRL